MNLPESRGETRAGRSEVTRRAILRAAEALLFEEGEKNLSIRGICKRAGVTAPTIYHHFGDRQRLIERIVDDHFVGFDAWMVGRPGPADPVEALRWAFDRYVEFGLASPLPYRLLFDRKSGTSSSHGISSFARMRDGMVALEATGGLRLSVDEAVLVFWSAMHGVTSLAILGVVASDSRVLTEVRDGIIARLLR